MSNGNQAKRLPQKDKCRNENESGILEDASTFAQRVLKEIEVLAGTTACKSVQLVRLKKCMCRIGTAFYSRSSTGNTTRDSQRINPPWLPS